MRPTLRQSLTTSYQPVSSGYDRTVTQFVDHYQRHTHRPISRYIMEMIILCCGAETITLLQDVCPRLLRQITIKKIEQINPHNIRYVDHLRFSSSDPQHYNYCFERLNQCSLLSLDCLFSNQITDTLMQRFTNLKFLNVRVERGSKLTERALINLTKLQTLFCAGDIVTDDVLLMLSNLLTLDCSSDRVTDRSIKCLTQLQGLRYCRNASNQRENVTEAAFKCLTNLVSFCAYPYFSEITDESLKRLTNLQTLQMGCQHFITHESLMLLTNLEVLECDHVSSLSDESLQLYTALRSLSCNGCRKLTFRSAQCLGSNGLDQTESRLTNLLTLHCVGCVEMRDECLMVLTQLVNLRLNGMYGTDAQCEYLSDQSIEQLTLLTELECKKFILITDRSIKKLTKLAVLQCGGCEGITDRSIEWLIRLTKLSCRNCKEITDWSMTRLTRLDSLYCNFLDPAQNCTTVKCSNGRGNVNNNSHGSNTYLSSEGITRESLDKLPHLKCVNALSYCSLREVKPSHTSKFDLIIESVRAGAMRLFESLSY